MSRGGRARAWPVALTARGTAQLAVAAALFAAGLAGGWHAVAAAGAALALAGAVGLVEVLLARGLRAGERGHAGPLGRPERSEDSWARVDQHGRVIGRPGRLPAERGLYRQRSVTLTWHDAFGFWRARRVEATDREVRVPPVADPALVRLVSSRAVARSLDRSAEPDPSGVRPYERGDGLRQISWRQSAHHGELMSLERAGDQAPPVLVVAVQDQPGGLAPILQLIAEGSIDIEYMYSLFTHKDGKAYMVFRVSDEEKFTALLAQHGIAMVAGEELGIQD